LLREAPFGARRFEQMQRALTLGRRQRLLPRARDDHALGRSLARSGTDAPLELADVRVEIRASFPKKLAAKPGIRDRFAGTASGAAS